MFFDILTIKYTQGERYLYSSKGRVSTFCKILRLYFLLSFYFSVFLAFFHIPSKAWPPWGMSVSNWRLGEKEERERDTVQSLRQRHDLEQDFWECIKDQATKEGVKMRVHKDMPSTVLSQTPDTVFDAPCSVFVSSVR